MQRNYDPSAKLPYLRVVKLSLGYPTEGPPSLTISEGQALVDNLGKPHQLAVAVSESSFDIDMTKATEPIQLVNPMTGAPVTGQFTTLQQCMVVLTSVVRKFQQERDAKEALQ